jgi:hypothetical protein
MPELNWQKSTFSGGPQGLAGLLHHVRATARPPHNT